MWCQKGKELEGSIQKGILFSMEYFQIALSIEMRPNFFRLNYEILVENISSQDFQLTFSPQKIFFYENLICRDCLEVAKATITLVNDFKVFSLKLNNGFFL